MHIERVYGWCYSERSFLRMGLNRRSSGLKAEGQLCVCETEICSRPLPRLGSEVLYFCHVCGLGCKAAFLRGVLCYAVWKPFREHRRHFSISLGRFNAVLMGVIFNQAAGVDRSCPQHSAWISSKAMWRGLSFTADALKKRLLWALYRQCACQRSSSSSAVCWMMALQNSAQWDQPVKERKWQSRQFTAAVRMQMAMEKSSLSREAMGVWSCLTGSFFQCLHRIGLTSKSPLHI